MSDWKNNRAEMAMRESGKKIMEEAAKKKDAEFKEIGKWKITLKGNSKTTKEEIDSFINSLIDFAGQEGAHAPNVEVSIDPLTE